jgi:phospho-N-acetylmuramoyl-pentapeptide-transferase
MQITKYAAVAVIAFAVSMLVTARMIPVLRNKQFGQFIREDGPQAHLSKAGTPTMGGIAMVVGITVALLASSFLEEQTPQFCTVLLLQNLLIQQLNSLLIVVIFHCRAPGFFYLLGLRSKTQSDKNQ